MVSRNCVYQLKRIIRKNNIETNSNFIKLIYPTLKEVNLMKFEMNFAPFRVGAKKIHKNYKTICPSFITSFLSVLSANTELCVTITNV